MMIPNVKDYEAAFNFLLEWLRASRDTARESLEYIDDEVQFATSDGYLTCCMAAIVIAEKMQHKLAKNGDKGND